MAYMGGIVKFLLLVIGYLITYYNKYALFVRLANRLYNFDLADKE